ncbi:MAG: hypothetical protein FWF66_01370 [Candidatus Bathyarchaeota archaeon]|nr:hypothetical protein [Candidatus Termiticorpusculum sp.]MCL1970102.1 hypothetical protein [Candidatus Termiticorpusculum sp.]
MGYNLLLWCGLLLGLVAWLLPIINLAITNKAKNKNWMVWSILSVSICAIVLCMQLYFTNHLVDVEGWYSLMDFYSGLADVSLVLLVVTLALNAVTIFVYRKNSEK